MSKVAFIGVGTMGAPMARNIAKGGHEVRAFDINKQAVARLADVGIEGAGSAAAAADGADIVITMLPNAQHVEEAAFGESGFAAAMPKSGLHIDMSTIAPSATDAIGERLKGMGIAMVDAPVGRQQEHAVAGKLMIMVGGSDENVERANPVLALMGDTIIHCGPLGAGGRMKVVNNFMSITINLAAAEALILAERAGIDVDLARKVMLGTVAGQGHFGTTYPSKVLKGDLEPGFMIDLARKDLGLAIDLAQELGAPLGSGKAAKEAYDRASADSRGRQDWTALYDHMRKAAGA